MAMIGGIYREGDDYAVSDGKQLFWLFDEIDNIKTDVDLNIGTSMEFVNGYCLSIDKAHKKWKIKDTGHKNCKHILAEGNYTGDFEKSIGFLLKMFVA